MKVVTKKKRKQRYQTCNTYKDVISCLRRGVLPAVQGKMRHGLVTVYTPFF